MISDQGNFKVTMKRLALCYPDLLGQSSKSQLCGSIGSLIIFKESQFADCCDFPEADGECVDPWSVKWVVVVPGTVSDFLRTKYFWYIVGQLPRKAIVTKGTANYEVNVV